MLDQVAGQLPALQRRIVLGDRAPAGAMSWGDLREAAAGASTDDLLAREELLQFDDPINIQYTSGTTGFPKGATLSHHNILNNGFFIGEGCRYTEADRVCIPVPLYHGFGMVLGNLACTTHGAAIVYPSESFDPVSTLAAVERERCTSLYGSRPRLGNRLAIAPTPGHVRAGGGAPLPEVRNPEVVVVLDARGLPPRENPPCPGRWSSCAGMGRGSAQDQAAQIMKDGSLVVHGDVGHHQLNGGQLADLGPQDWALIRLYLEANERIFGMPLGRLLAVR